MIGVRKNMNKTLKILQHLTFHCITFNLFHGVYYSKLILCDGVEDNAVHNEYGLLHTSHECRTKSF